MTSRAKRPKAEVKSELRPVKQEERSLIHDELERFQKQVEEILTALESINLMGIADTEERLKAVKTKLELNIKLPILLQALDDLRNKAKLKSENIKGSKNISLLESGALK